MTRIPFFAGVALAFFSGPALATNAVVTNAAHMFAGPGDNYPQVMRLSAGRPVTIYGCLAAQDWCDVEWRGNRGWVTGYALTMESESGTIANTGRHLDVPNIRFDVRTYWEENYKERPWYADRDTWYKAISARPQVFPARIQTQ